MYHSFFLGIIITFVYDNIRVCRRVIRHNTFFISIEDLFFWIAVAISIFLLQHKENNGVFRWFSIIGAFIGMLLYRKIISGFYIKHMTFFFKKLLHGIYTFFSYIFSPVYYVERQILLLMKKSTQKSRHALALQKIRLTSYGKMIKMTLCKRKKKRRKKKGKKHEQKDSRS